MNVFEPDHFVFLVKIRYFSSEIGEKNYSSTCVTLCEYIFYKDSQHENCESPVIVQESPIPDAAKGANC